MLTRVSMKLSQTAKRQFSILIIIFIVLAFFHKTIIFGQIPAPLDLLVGHYEPYKSYSYLGYAPGGVPHKAQGPDVIKELLPWKHFVIDSLKQFQIPFWNPYNFSGNPQIANFQSGVFYPTNLLFFILNFEIAWSIYIILIPILAAYFTYIFLRRLNVSHSSSIFGGISFAFSSYMVVWIEYGNIGHTLLWLPLILFFTDRLLEKVNYKNSLYLIVSSLLSILAGYIQGVFYIYAIVFVYFFAKGNLEKKLNPQKIILFLFSLIFPILLSLFQILPTLELFQNSTRGNYSLLQIQKNLNQVYYLITVAVPDFFGNPATRNYWIDGTYIEKVSYFGLIPFVFAVFAILTLIKKTEVKIFSFLLIGSVALSTDLFVTRFFYLLPIPVISTTVATRLLSIFAFSGSILASFGLDRILENKNKRQFFLIGIGFLIFLCTLLLFVSFYPKIVNEQHLVSSFNVAKRNLILPIGTLIIFIGLTGLFYRSSLFKGVNKYKKMIYKTSVFLIVFIDLFYYFQKITPFSPREYLYPQTPVVEFLKKNAGIDRFWGYGSAYIESNFQTYDKTFSPEGNDPLHIKNYTELLSSSANGRVPKTLPRPDANVAPGFGKESLKENPFRQKVLNVIGVKYVFHKDETINGDYNPDYVTFPEDKYKLIWQEKPWQVYENQFVTPRYFITNKYEVVENNKRALRTLFDPEFNEKDTIILYEDPNIPKNNLNSKVDLLYYSPNKVIFKTNSSDKALLYLSDNHYPGWRASLDREPVKIYLANYAFRAVPIEAGQHELVFEYAPQSFYRGLYLSGAAIVILFYCSIVIKKKYG